MYLNRRALLAVVLLLPVCYSMPAQVPSNNTFITYIADLSHQSIKMYLKDDNGKPFGSIQNLKNWLSSKSQRLVFAMNGGMYKPGNEPLGLFIAQQKRISPLNTKSGYGNFYLQPNGVFYITTNNKAAICKTEQFAGKRNILYATQSGPILVVDGQIHSAFKQGSSNVNIRNGVGILPDNKVVFAMSEKEINFYDFALYFKQLGCKYALYLDGFVSRTYLPEKNWVQLDGDFGVIIGVTQ